MSLNAEIPSDAGRFGTAFIHAVRTRAWHLKVLFEGFALRLLFLLLKSRSLCHQAVQSEICQMFEHIQERFVFSILI